MTFKEYNFDGLVGLSHHYGGHSFGNVASSGNAALVSNPKQAALQGLLKAKTLADMGLENGLWGQAILPPQERPFMPALRQLGFAGNDAEIIEQAAKHHPQIFAKCCSAASMWTANAATISPSLDTHNGKLHFTPANLVAMYHRSVEHVVTGRVLKSIFADPAHFDHHAALPQNIIFGDEGAANHTRFFDDINHQGVEFFTFGADALATGIKPQRYPARQTLEASRIIARQHGLPELKTVFGQQNPDAIDAGVFHNDVIAVGHGNFILCHELAFVDNQKIYADIEAALGAKLFVHEVSQQDLPIKDVVSSYLFNSQIIGNAKNGMTLIAPEECTKNRQVSAVIGKILADNGPVNAVKYFDVKQSMQNGGGPACLRLRVLMNDAQVKAINARVLLDDDLYADLVTWVHKHYRDRLEIADMADIGFYHECCAALDELTKIMKLGAVYDFQRR
ncbi:MAG: N-succinylarginine dihydrolase [Rhizobiales bacterium]|nr:N-succinylarginine dihydrolase [Hyphomicrobiales bacterium]NRB14362.1 N-succinylarginine dihydrolase [Hyphomicrobiales bacterium]